MYGWTKEVSSNIYTTNTTVLDIKVIVGCCIYLFNKMTSTCSCTNFNLCGRNQFLQVATSIICGHLMSRLSVLGKNVGVMNR